MDVMCCLAVRLTVHAGELACLEKLPRRSKISAMLAHLSAHTIARDHDADALQRGRGKAPHHGELHGCARICLWRAWARPGRDGPGHPRDLPGDGQRRTTAGWEAIVLRLRLDGGGAAGLGRCR